MAFTWLSGSWISERSKELWVLQQYLAVWNVAATMVETDKCDLEAWLQLKCPILSIILL